MEKYDSTLIDFNEETVVMEQINIPTSPSYKELHMFICKIFIFILKDCTQKTLNIHKVEAMIRRYEAYEKYYTIKNNILEKHINKWYPKSRSMPNERIENYAIEYLLNS